MSPEQILGVGRAAPAPAPVHRQMRLRVANGLSQVQNCSSASCCWESQRGAQAGPLEAEQAVRLFGSPALEGSSQRCPPPLNPGGWDTETWTQKQQYWLLQSGVTSAVKKEDVSIQPSKLPSILPSSPRASPGVGGSSKYCCQYCRWISLGWNQLGPAWGTKQRHVPGVGKKNPYSVLTPLGTLPPGLSKCALVVLVAIKPRLQP